MTDPVRTAYFSSELSRQASGAKANLALLPENSTKLEKTAKFLSQVGDYASYISQKSLRGEELEQAREMIFGILSDIVPLHENPEIGKKKRFLVKLAQKHFEGTCKILNFLIDIHVLS